MEAVFIYNNNPHLTDEGAIENLYNGKEFSGHILYLNQYANYEVKHFSERRVEQIQVLSYNRIGTKSPIIHVVNTYKKVY